MLTGPRTQIPKVSYKSSLVSSSLSSMCFCDEGAMHACLVHVRDHGVHSHVRVTHEEADLIGFADVAE
eukprot:11897110-Alexandrium_andersonii.AAC.1